MDALMQNISRCLWINLRVQQLWGRRVLKNSPTGFMVLKGSRGSHSLFTETSRDFLKQSFLMTCPSPLGLGHKRSGTWTPSAWCLHKLLPSNHNSPFLCCCLLYTASVNIFAGPGTARRGWSLGLLLEMV